MTRQGTRALQCATLPLRYEPAWRLPGGADTKEMGITSLKPRIATLRASIGSALAPVTGAGWARQGRASRHERGYGSQWVRLVKAIRARDHDLCQACARQGRYSLYAAVDHITSRSQGGSDAQINLEVICGACHAAKTAREARGSSTQV